MQIVQFKAHHVTLLLKLNTLMYAYYFVIGYTRHSNNVCVYVRVCVCVCVNT